MQFSKLHLNQVEKMNSFEIYVLFFLKKNIRYVRQTSENTEQYCKPVQKSHVVIQNIVLPFVTKIFGLVS